MLSLCWHQCWLYILIHTHKQTNTTIALILVIAMAVSVMNMQNVYTATCVYIVFRRKFTAWKGDVGQQANKRDASCNWSDIYFLPVSVQAVCFNRNIMFEFIRLCVEKIYFSLSPNQMFRYKKIFSFFQSLKIFRLYSCIQLTIGPQKWADIYNFTLS